MLPAVLGIAAAFFGGAYTASVINNATEQPDVVIQTENVTQTQNKQLTNQDLVIAGMLGIAGWWIWKNYLK